jgi:thermitase
VLSDFSNYGNNIDLAAPEGVYTTTRGGGYSYQGGTSFSAPIVAGVAALALSVDANLTGAQVQDILKQNADDLGTPGWDSSYGWGRINAARAVNAASGGGAPDTTPPTVSITSPVGPQLSTVHST